jgi:hypothetical protein
LEQESEYALAVFYLDRAVKAGIVKHNVESKIRYLSIRAKEN